MDFLRPEWARDYKELEDFLLTDFEKTHYKERNKTMTDTNTETKNPELETQNKKNFAGLCVVTLQGRLARDPEVIGTASGKMMTVLTVAVNDGKGGAQFIRCLTFDSDRVDGPKVATNHAMNLEKGQLITMLADLKPDRSTVIICRKCREKMEFPAQNKWVVYPFRVYYGPKAQQKAIDVQPENPATAEAEVHTEAAA